LSAGQSSKGTTRGYVVPIGGGESRRRNPTILRRFVEICGDSAAHIAVIPTASKRADTGPRYERVFRDLGAETATVLPFKSRSECYDERNLAVLEEVSGVFMTGGNQVRLSSIIGDTPVATRIRTRHLEGLHVAGTSAGAAIMPEHMIAGGESGSIPRVDMVEMAHGLGLTDRLVIDQHFRQRERLGRLLAAVAANPTAVGIGLDEDTGAFIDANDLIEVVGSGGVTVVDPTDMEHANLDDEDDDAPISLIGLRLHFLIEGGAYDITTRTPYL
jgi:cyanophycinase